MIQNSFTFIGKVAKDIEQKKVGDKVVTTVRLAVKRKAGDKTQTDFFDVRMWNGLGDTAFKYLNKGRLIAVTGYIKTRIVEVNGRKAKLYDFIADDFRFLDSKGNIKDSERTENTTIGEEEIENIEEELENILEGFEEVEVDDIEGKTGKESNQKKASKNEEEDLPF